MTGNAVAALRERGRLAAVGLALLVAAYLAWKVGQSPQQALQFAFNGMAVGAIYALLAMGFTLVYSTVWFFDLYYGAAATLGAYGVFYLRSSDALYSRYEAANPFINGVLALVVGGVVAWALHVGPAARLRAKLPEAAYRALIAALGISAAAYTLAVLSFPEHLRMLLAPAIGLAAAIAIGRLAFGVLWTAAGTRARAVAATLAGSAAGAASGYFLAGAEGADLYLSWLLSCLLAGSVGLALYRGLYVHMRARAKSPLIMLVASLGILLSLTAFISIAFESAPRPLPEAFGTGSVTVGGAYIKGFSIFAIAVALLGFAALWLMLGKTTFGRAVRAIGDDEQVARVVGINTVVVVSIVFFIGAVYAALAGVISGHDTAIQPRMGLLLLLKGWIASVVGGIGNLYGAILGGFVLGMVEQFGIWDLAGEWRDAIAFVLLILFLSFWPNGLLPGGRPCRRAPGCKRAGVACWRIRADSVWTTSAASSCGRPWPSSAGRSGSWSGRASALRSRSERCSGSGRSLRSA